MLNTRNILLTGILALFLFSSCSKQSEESLLLDAKNKMEEATKLDNDNKPDEAKKAYEEVIAIYKKLIDYYPNSEKAPAVYSNIAKIYSDNLRDYNNAIKYYQEISEKFPQTREAKYAMFMIAFIYDEMLKDKNMAKESYKKFLDKYPKDEDPNEKMSESARMMLQMLDENRSIEDIIKDTQQNPKDTSKSKEPEKKETEKKETTKETPKDANVNPDGTTSSPSDTKDNGEAPKIEKKK
jgi:tetratricopeptide (TPR) repeat protein